MKLKSVLKRRDIFMFRNTFFLNKKKPENSGERIYNLPALTIVILIKIEANIPFPT